MKSSSLYLVLALIVMGVIAVVRFSANAAEPAKPLALTFKDVNGEKLNLKDYRGKVVVIDVWATWCGYCVREMPDIVEYQQEAIDKKIPLQIIGLSVDRPQDKPDVLKLMKEMEINYPISIANKETLKPFGKIAGIPVKFLIDKRGILVDKRVGAMPREALEEWLEPYLKEKVKDEKKK